MISERPCYVYASPLQQGKEKGDPKDHSHERTPTSHLRPILTSLTFLSLGKTQTSLIFTLAYSERSSHLRTISEP
jgi:hypothetical protein